MRMGWPSAAAEIGLGPNLVEAVRFPDTSSGVKDTSRFGYARLSKMATSSSSRRDFNPFRRTENSKTCSGSSSPFSLLEERSNVRTGLESRGSTTEDADGAAKAATVMQRTAEITGARQGLYEGNSLLHMFATGTQDSAIKGDKRE